MASLYVLQALMFLPLQDAVAQGQADSWVDRDRFPEAYGILTSDRVMFPDDISDWPLRIGTTHQMFVDDYMISEISGLTRQFHQPVKHPENPLLPGGYAAVLRDDGTGLFRMWNDRRLFTSTDGVHWEAPDLGPKGNEVIHDAGQLRGFMVNPNLPEDEGRYKAVIERRFSEEEEEPGGFYLYHSHDGIHWKQRPEKPILQRSTNCMFPCDFRSQGVGEPAQFQYQNPDHFQAYGVGDTSTFRYDSVLDRYIFDGKFNIVFPPERIRELGIITDGKPRLKLRTFSESDDLIHWSPPRLILYPDRLDPADRQIYAHVGFVYESMWFGIMQAMQFQVEGWKQTDLRLTYSRDGRHWLRSDKRQPFIPLGGADSWDADYSISNYTAPVLVDEQLYFYYGSSRHPDRDKDAERRWPLHLGLAMLRRDGFASLNAGDAPGQLVTRPMKHEGRTLFVNADVLEDGWVKAAVLSRDSEPIPGYELDDSMPLTEDTTAGQMTWRSKEALAPSGDDHRRILFQLKNAKLYSFWVE